MSEVKEVELSETVKSMDEFIKDFESVDYGVFLKEGEVDSRIQELQDLKDFRAALFASENYVKSLIKSSKESIIELNEKVDRIIKLKEVAGELQEVNKQMYVQLQRVGGIFNQFHDDMSAAAKDTDFVDAGSVAKILNNYVRFQVDEDVFAEDEIIKVDTDTSYEG